MLPVTRSSEVYEMNIHDNSSPEAALTSPVFLSTVPPSCLTLIAPEMNMNAVERTDAYCHLEQEAPTVLPGSGTPPPSWPSQGEISVRCLTLAYPSAPTAPVLRSLSFHIPPGTRVGVVGRTGAGKSSLLAAFYRLVEPAEGSEVVIDGVNTRHLGLKDLRGRLAIVPQEVRLKP
jgi:ABC-type multidrug transport system fused ATPase/permease subunit